MSADRDFTPLAGGCPCGQARFHLTGAPIITPAGQCRNCQKVSGAAFSVNAMIESDRLELIAGRTVLFEPRAGQGEVQCPDCRYSLWSYIPMFGKAIAFVGVGRLDEGERLAPEAHYFIRSKHPWIGLPAGVPAFSELGDPGKPGMGARVGAALAAAGLAPPPGFPS